MMKVWGNKMSSEQKKLECSYKEMAVFFLQLVASETVQTAFEQYISANFTHHNPYFRGNAQSLMRVMEEKFEVKRVSAERERRCPFRFRGYRRSCGTYLSF